jgi:hypothetical protein
LQKKIGSHDMKQTDSSIIIVRMCACLRQHPWLFIFSSRGHDRQSSEQGHAHIICITVREDRIICCQIFCDLLLKSAFERICNVMQLILVKIKWHIKWKYLIQKFLHICLSYYFKCYRWSWYICHSTVCVLFNINFIWSNIEKWSDPNFAKSR